MQNNSDESAGIHNTRPVSRRFVALYTLAQIGAFVAFLPLLQILLPLRAVAIDPLHGTALLSQISLVGAAVASLSNILVGAMSDRTRSKRGRRRPWLLGGLAATLGSYVLIERADTPGHLLLAMIAFQLAFNGMFSPLGAVLADEIPERQRGLMSALLGLGNPIGSVVGLWAVGAWRMGDATRYEVVASIVLFCVLPFAWWLRGGRSTLPGRLPAADARQSLKALFRNDLVLVWISRLLVVTTIAIIQSYLLLFLRSRNLSLLHFLGRPEAAIAQMTVIATTCNVGCGLACGILSDRVGRRTLFAAVGAVLLAVGMGCLALTSNWAGLQWAAVFYGSGIGMFSTIDLALIIQILPSVHQAGEVLGIMNLCNTVAQVVAPSLALLVLESASPNFRPLFGLAGVVSLLGAACLGGVSGWRWHRRPRR